LSFKFVTPQNPKNTRLFGDFELNVSIYKTAESEKHVTLRGQFLSDFAEIVF